MPVLQFKGKTAIESYHHTVPHHILDFDAKLSVLPKGQKPSLDGNLIIEGDNLLALKALLPTHAGRIKCIYIDPPYNTGNEGWIFNDNLTQPQFKEWIGQTVGKEAEDFCRHDKWCCMMYPRLQLLKELLREDGVIFVSIGDDEIADLRFLMDEIFGEINFIAHIVWQKRYVSNVTAQFLSDMHDHILLFARQRMAVKLQKMERDQELLEDYRNPDNDPRGDWRAQDLSASKPYKAGVFTIKGPTGKSSIHHQGDTGVVTRNSTRSGSATIGFGSEKKTMRDRC
jgi:adenine-specific DNA-methyltransferase